MATQQRSDWLEKVQKLLAKAESTRGTPESDVFFAKAAELIERWQIEDVELARPDDRVTILRVDLPSTIFRPLWHLASGLAILCDCRSLASRYSPGIPAAVHVYGWQSDLIRFELLFKTLTASMRAGAAGRDRASREAWCRGYADAIRLRCVEITRARVNEQVIRAETGSTALVLVSRRDEVDKAASRNSGGPRIRTKSRQGAAGYEEGMQAGYEASLTEKEMTA